MAPINLLPWRVERKQKRQRDYLLLLLLSAVVAALLMLLVSTYYASKMDRQQQRNRYLAQQTAVLDRQIEQLNSLKKQKKELEQRLELIQNLQQSRNLVTQLFNTLAAVVPSGIYLEQIEKTGDLIRIKGVSDSNNRLATLVRHIEQISWFAKASIQSVTTDEKLPKPLNHFEMTMMLKVKVKEPSPTKTKRD